MSKRKNEPPPMPEDEQEFIRRIDEAVDTFMRHKADVITRSHARITIDWMLDRYPRFYPMRNQEQCRG